MIIKKLFKNPASIYIASRYGTYGIQFINSIFLSIYLGPYYLGIWGFITLMVGYLEQLKFGVPSSVNVLISVNKKDEGYVEEIIGNAISILILITIALSGILLIIKFGNVSVGEKYHLNQFIIPLIIIVSLSFFNTLFSTIFRVYGKIYEIAINQSLFPLLTLSILPFFRSEKLLWAIVGVYTLSFFISTIIFTINRPTSFKPRFNSEIIKIIQKKGIFLFVYSTSFYLILLSTRSFISNYYKVEEFGYFTFSFSLANAVLLFLNAISFLITPKLLNRFANSSNDHIQAILDSIRSSYITLSHFLIHIIILAFPIFLYFFEAYNDALHVFKLTAITIVLYTNSFGYQAILMAKSKEKSIATISIISLTLNVAIGFILVISLKVGYEYIILCTLITYIIYNYFIARVGRKILNLPVNFSNIVNDVFPISIMIPFIISVSFTLYKADNVYYFMPVILFIILNFKKIEKIKNLVMKAINNKNFIEI